jgi:hypothetical protein
MPHINYKIQKKEREIKKQLKACSKEGVGERERERERERNKANIIIYPHYTVTPISKMPSCETSCSLFGWTNKSQD